MLKTLITSTAIIILSAVQLFAQSTHEKRVALKLSVFAESKNQWTGIAISPKNRMFVNFPRWSDEMPVSVGEVINGRIVPFPNTDWNNWNPGISAENRFICVQSVLIDNANTIWILDTGYDLRTDSTKQANLYRFDLSDNHLLKTYKFPAALISGKSYLNDFRIDNKHQIVYLTDSQVGGIVLLDLKTGQIHRVLSHHPSTLSEVSKITIEGYERTHPVHSDGIELDSENKYLYYCALMGENVYRIPTSALLDSGLTDSQRGTLVQKFAKTGANDGIIFDKKRNLYLSSLEKNGIGKVDKNGNFKEIISDNAIQWPDSFAFDIQGNLFFTTSQIHLPKEKRKTYKIFKLQLR